MKANRLVSHKVVEMPPARPHQSPVSPLVALRALYELLEDYGPMWYTQEAHDLASAALQEHLLN